MLPVVYAQPRIWLRTLRQRVTLRAADGFLRPKDQDEVDFVL